MWCAHPESSWTGAGGGVGEPSNGQGRRRAGTGGGGAAGGEEEEGGEHEEALVGVPARVCPAAKSVPQHKDKADGYGACVSSWICVVYLTRQPGSALVLVDDVSGIESRVAIEPGRLCCWPNARFSHRVDVDATVAAAAAVAQGARWAASDACSARWPSAKPLRTARRLCTRRAAVAAAAVAAVAVAAVAVAAAAPGGTGGELQSRTLPPSASSACPRCPPS